MAYGLNARGACIKYGYYTRILFLFFRGIDLLMPWQLQAAAQIVHATHKNRLLLVSNLRCMKELRAFVNETVLLQQENGPIREPIHVLDEAAALVAAVQEELDWQSPSRKAVEAERHARLQRELDAITSLRDQANDASLSGVHVLRLGEIIVALRAREQSCEFHRDLLLAVGDQSAYSVDNFAYGNTPFDSWARVCLCETIQRASRQWPTIKTSEASEVTTQVVVVGSSSGSLVFFTSALLGHACTGIEILPFLHHVAEELNDQYKATNCEFLQADILAVSLRNVRLVVLTSQCWDAKLYDQVLEKMGNELETGSLVVDYRNGLERSKAFCLAERLDGLRVSWNPDQSFFIYEHS